MNVCQLCLFAPAALLLAFTGCSEVPDAPPETTSSTSALSQSEPPGHLLLVVETGPEGLRVISSREVDGPAPRPRGEHPQAWRASILDEQGATLDSFPLADPTELRAEWTDENGNLTGQHVTVDRGAFVVRVPRHAAAAHLRLTAPEPGGKSRAVGTARIPGAQR